jgi:hypothetical protein
MSYASQSGRARTDPSNPKAHAICDRCGFRHNLINLQWQFDWRGAALQNLRILVCRDCLDTPQEQLRAIVVPADPVPIMNARVQDFALAEGQVRTLSGGGSIDPVTGIPIPGQSQRITQDGLQRTEQVSGAPLGYDQNAVMPLEDDVPYRVRVPVASVTAFGTDQITVTCSSVHGLADRSQIAVNGLANDGACGLFTIKVTTATAFTYQTNRPIPAGALLTGSTLMVTADVGLPYNSSAVPQTGG